MQIFNSIEQIFAQIQTLQLNQRIKIFNFVQTVGFQPKRLQIVVGIQSFNFTKTFKVGVPNQQCQPIRSLSNQLLSTRTKYRLTRVFHSHRCPSTVPAMFSYPLKALYLWFLDEIFPFLVLSIGHVSNLSCCLFAGLQEEFSEGLSV